VKKLLPMVGLLGMVIFFLVLAACSSDKAETDQLKADNAALTKQNEALKQLAGPPPASLDQYFPPAAPAPLFLIEMFGLAGPFEGVGVDLQEQDIAGVKANYQAFKTQYDKVAAMVPEWKDRFPLEPVTALGTAIDGGNPAQIGPAMGKVGEICGSCHALYQIKTQQKYHWKSFDEIKVTDPVSGQEMEFGDYMVAMAGSFEGAFIDMGEGQLDKAHQNYEAFSTQFKALGENACKECHQDPTGKEIPRKYYVDDDSLALVAQLGQALAANPPDAEAIGNLSGAIGNSICLNCHLVHLPAQNTKDNWETFQDILK
jgi:cytochrome c556